MLIQVNDLKKKLSENHNDLLAELDLLAKRAEALREPDNDESCQAFLDMANEISALEKRIEEARVTEKAPFRSLCDEVDAFFRESGYKGYQTRRALKDKAIEYLRNRRGEARNPVLIV